jgi:hypothetical protein
LRESAPRRFATGLLNAHTQNHLQPQQLVRFERLHQTRQSLLAPYGLPARPKRTNTRDCIGNFVVCDAFEHAGQAIER